MTTSSIGYGILFLVIGYGLNMIDYHAFCDDTMNPTLAKVLTPLLVIPFAPGIVLSLLMVGLLIGVILLTIAMGLLSLYEMMSDAIRAIIVLTKGR